MASSQLPREVSTTLQNARFLHLATASLTGEPHISLMNYTFLPTSPYSTGPIIVLSTTTSSTKTSFLQSNPRVALLVHDWVHSRPRAASFSAGAAFDEVHDPSGYIDSGGAAQGEQQRQQSPGERGSSLANLLQNLNSAQMSSISASINGIARFPAPETEEEKWYRNQHVQNHYLAQEGGEAWIPPSGNTGEQDSTRSDTSAIQSERRRRASGIAEELVLVVVEITGGRIADWEGSVRDWTVTKAGDNHGNNGLANGI